MNTDKTLQSQIRYLLMVAIDLNEKGYIRLAHEIEIEIEKIKQQYDKAELGKKDL